MSESNAEQRLPLFYSKPVPLRAENHGGYALATEADYRYAAVTNAVPLNAIEFAPAARSYPIVFTGDADPVPLAVLGLTVGQNLFVDADGAWRAGEYIPAYVRRYPFLFFERRGAGQFSLGVDEASTLIRADGDGRALFDGDQPSEVSRQALEFCTAFQRELMATRELVAALKDAELLIARSLNVNRADGSTHSVSDFQIVDEEKLKQLGDDRVLDWQRKGYLGAVYAQTISLGCWSRLVALDGAEPPAQAP